MTLFCLAWSLKSKSISISISISMKWIYPRTNSKSSASISVPFSPPSIICNFQSTHENNKKTKKKKKIRKNKNTFSLYYSHYLLLSCLAPKPPDLSATTLCLVYRATLLGKMGPWLSYSLLRLYSFHYY